MSIDRSKFAEWSLAGDQNVLSFLFSSSSLYICIFPLQILDALKEFSTSLMSQTMEVQTGVESLSTTAQSMSIHVDDVFNHFHLLSNEKFVENVCFKPHSYYMSLQYFSDIDCTVNLRFSEFMMTMMN